MRQPLLSAFVMLLAGALPALADDVSDTADIAAARKFIEPVMGKTCDFQRAAHGSPDGYQVYHLSFRAKGQDQDSPDYERTLVALPCSSGAFNYNFNSIYLMRDDEGVWQFLSFAQPVVDFDYMDEDFSRLKAPPRVTGYKTVTQLTNTEFSEDTKTIRSTAKWRVIGDAWSSGEYQFVEGAFVLKKYEVDPTFQAPGEEEPDPNVPESYVVFDATAATR